MNPITFLSSEDFVLDNSERGKILCIKKNPDNAVVMFYSTKCEYCHMLMPFYKSLPHNFQGVNFCLLNVSNSPQVVHASQNTLTPIKHVPLIIFYKNGRPMYQYSGSTAGKEGEKQIFEFLNEILAKVSSKTTFVAQNTPKTSSSVATQQSSTVSKPNIPEYLICKPIGDGEQVCWLSMESAYIKK